MASCVYLKRLDWKLHLCPAETHKAKILSSVIVTVIEIFFVMGIFTIKYREIQNKDAQVNQKVLHSRTNNITNLSPEQNAVKKTWVTMIYTQLYDINVHVTFYSGDPLGCCGPAVKKTSFLQRATLVVSGWYMLHSW